MSSSKIECKGYEIRKSGKTLYKVMKDGEWVFYRRFVSVEACKVSIDSTLEHRPYTPAEHAIVYPDASYRQ